MHSRIIELSKNSKTEPISEGCIPDWFVEEYADYVISQHPEHYEEDFKWFNRYAKANYNSAKHMMSFNPDYLNQIEEDPWGFYVYLREGDLLHGLDPDECLMTLHQFGQLLSSANYDDCNYYAISSLDFHF